eukprot:11197317-Lingulodinium_polyedra.AAC.1
MVATAYASKKANYEPLANPSDTDVSGDDSARHPASLALAVCTKGPVAGIRGTGRSSEQQDSRNWAAL